MADSISIPLNLGPNSPQPSTAPPNAAPGTTPAPNAAPATGSNASAIPTHPPSDSEKIVMLRDELTRISQDLDEERLKRLQAESHVRSNERVESQGSLELKRQRAIAACGGLAPWHQMSVADRVRAMGYATPTEQTLQAVKQYVGKASDSALATGLARKNPHQYSYYRVVGRELGLI